MDVLFGSIDVRELLSTQDFEESSPLSAPDLRLLIDRLQVRSVHIKEKVHDYIHSHHNDFAEIFSRCSDAILKTEDISSDVNTILSLISDHPIDIEIHDAASEISSKRRELKEKKELLSLVQTIVNLMERLKLVRENLKTGRLIDAAESLRDLKKALVIREDQGVDEREPAVFGLLRKEWMECFDELQEVLARIMGNAVHFEPENGRVRVKSRLSSGAVEEVELHTVLTAMDVAGTLDYGLAKVADLIVKHVVIPAVRDGRNFNFEEGFNQDSTQMAEAILSLVPSSDSKVDSAAIYSGLVQVIKFIHKSICFQNGRWMKCFGRLTWPTISELVISNILSKAAPDDASKVAEFQKIIKLTTEFEAALKELMFISSTDSEDEKLTNFALNIEVHFASRKKREILAKARNLVLQYDTACPSDTVDLLFLPEKCVVSKAASQLMELVHQTLQDVCLSSARVAMEFYHAARDALLLYEAVVPVKLERQLNGINQVATLVHNDCLFLCQEILGLAFEYRPDFPSCVKEKVVFADMAPRFHQMAEQTLQKQIQLVSMNLKEAIDGADGFQNTHQKQQYDSAKFSIDQVVFILEKVHIIWEPLLQPLTYKRTMCIVLDIVFLKLTQDILLLDDMAAEETLQLQRLIHMTLDSLSSLVGSIVAIEEKDELQEDVTPNQLDVLLPSLRKLRILADLLDMSLKSIITMWESGELANCGFTSSEVKDFIKAIFTDSPLRRDCLWRIESINF